MILKQTKTWKIVTKRFKEKYGYNIEEHPSSNLIKFLIKCVEKEKENDFKNFMDSKKM